MYFVSPREGRKVKVLPFLVYLLQKLKSYSYRMAVELVQLHPWTSLPALSAWSVAHFLHKGGASVGSQLSDDDSIRGSCPSSDLICHSIPCVFLIVFITLCVCGFSLVYLQSPLLNYKCL